MYKSLNKFILLCGILVLTMGACDDDGPKKLGSSCTAGTTCEGVCNTALPDGMCVEVCNEYTTPCDKGVCVDFGDVDYCMPTCTDNSNCRTGYSCIPHDDTTNKCAPVSPIGDSCDDIDDCLACDEQTTCLTGVEIQCKEGACSTKCNEQTDCESGNYCALSDAEYWCVPVDFSQEAGTNGQSCAINDCATDFICLDSGTLDPDAYCSQTCTTNRNCPPQMYCGEYSAGNFYCMPRVFCDSCDMDTHCDYQTDKCLAASRAENEGERYCSIQCDIDIADSCVVNSTCKEAFYCETLSAWVDDCTDCTNAGCSSAAPPVYQCFMNIGACL
jgi:hypothetical protein